MASCQLQCTALEVRTATEGKATHSVGLGQWGRRGVGRANIPNPVVVGRAAGASTEPQVRGRRHEEAVLNLSEARVRAVVQAEANRRTEVG